MYSIDVIIYDTEKLNIDKLFMHVYDDNVSGKISDDRFRNLSFNYDKEQQELKLKIEQLSKRY